jgi:hypothetical protein
MKFVKLCEACEILKMQMEDAKILREAGYLTPCFEKKRRFGKRINVLGRYCKTQVYKLRRAIVKGIPFHLLPMDHPEEYYRKAARLESLRVATSVKRMTRKKICKRMGISKRMLRDLIRGHLGSKHGRIIDRYDWKAIRDYYIGLGNKISAADRCDMIREKFGVYASNTTIRLMITKSGGIRHRMPHSLRRAEIERLKSEYSNPSPNGQGGDPAAVSLPFRPSSPSTPDKKSANKYGSRHDEYYYKFWDNAAAEVAENIEKSQRNEEE